MRWLFAALICGLAPSAQAAVQTNIGTLTCTLAEEGDRAISPPSQQRDMLCSFKPNGTGPEERYSGEIKNVGSSTALSGKLVLIWVVMGPEHVTMEPGLLSQTYMGELASSDDDAKTKAPRMLVGESNDSYALRPLNEGEGETGGGVNNVTVIVLKMKSTHA